MIGTGLLEDKNVELIKGEVVEMTPEGFPDIQVKVSSTIKEK